MKGNLLAVVAGVAVAGLFACQARAITIYTERGGLNGWESAVQGPWYDVNLNKSVLSFTESGTTRTLPTGNPIYLPRDYSVSTLTFNQLLKVENGSSSFFNYFPGDGPPLVLSTFGSETLRGTFAINDPANPNDFPPSRKFGFEFLPLKEDGTIATLAEIKITLFGLGNDTVLGAYSINFLDFSGTQAQFFGWISDTPVGAFEISVLSGNVARLVTGNYVVPETGATLGLLGVACLALAGVRSRFLRAPQN